MDHTPHLGLGEWRGGHRSARGSCSDEHRQGPGWDCGAPSVLAGASEGTMLHDLVVASPVSHSSRPETCVSSGSLSKMPTTGKQQKPKLSSCLDSHQFPVFNNRLFQAPSLGLVWLFGPGPGAVSWAK